MKFVPKSFTLTENQVRIIEEKSKQLGVTPSETMRRILDKAFNIDLELTDNAKQNNDNRDQDKV